MCVCLFIKIQIILKLISKKRIKEEFIYKYYRYLHILTDFLYLFNYLRYQRISLCLALIRPMFFIFELGLS